MVSKHILAVAAAMTVIGAAGQAGATPEPTPYVLKPSAVHEGITASKIVLPLNEAALSSVDRLPGAAAVTFHAFPLLQSSAHERVYLKLLAQTYAPETADAWKAALEARKAVETELRKPAWEEPIRIQQRELPPDQNGGAPIRIELKKVETAENREPSGDVIIKREIGSTPDSVIVKKEIGSIPGDVIIKREPPAEWKLQQALAEAVEAEDQEQIRKLLGELLDSYRSHTDRLQKLVTAGSQH